MLSIFPLSTATVNPTARLRLSSLASKDGLGCFQSCDAAPILGGPHHILGCDDSSWPRSTFVCITSSVAGAATGRKAKRVQPQKIAHGGLVVDVTHGRIELSQRFCLRGEDGVRQQAIFGSHRLLKYLWASDGEGNPRIDGNVPGACCMRRI